MIHIERLRIQEFRGIRDLELQPNGESFLIHGPNGSGKSGIVDAISFALTGDIARLSGPGTGGLSVADHGPHVHRRDDPARAKITMTFTVPGTGESGTLARCVKTPSTFELEPDTPALRTAIEAASQHPELILTRREVIKFVLAEPGKRAKEVQALLQLDRLSELRGKFRTLQGLLRKQSEQAASAMRVAEGELAVQLQRDQVLGPELLAAVNSRRAKLSANSLDTLTADTRLDSGLTPRTDEPALNKALLTSELEHAKDALARWRLLGRGTATEPLTSATEALRAVTDAEHILSQVALARAGLAGLCSTRCPLCDIEWATEQLLRDHIQQKLDDAAHVQAALEALEMHRSRLITAAEEVRSAVVVAGKAAVALGHEPIAAECRIGFNKLDADERALSTASLESLFNHLSSRPFDLGEDVEAGAQQLIALAAALPEPSEAAAAASWLAVAADRWTRLCRTRSTAAKTAAAAKAGEIIYSSYCRSQDAELTALYETVQHRFSVLYRYINEGDEDQFRASLEPSAAKLDLAVDFYGLGMFPPGAYHSEGHQDGMGLALYLALLEETLGDQLGVVVLDDVITSVDIQHRRRLCSLLGEQFAPVQFFITTHEPVWARTLLSRYIPRRASIEFLGWNVDAGPVCAVSGDIFERIDEDLAKADVNGAAAKLRRFLEFRTHEAAQVLQAKVAFREDGDYQLGDLMDSVVSRHKDLLKKARASARAFNRTDVEAQVIEMEAARAAAVRDHGTEQWAINKLVHFNQDMNLSPQEFRATLDASRKLLAVLECAHCQRGIYTEGGASATTLRCKCGAYMLNLLT